MGVKIEDIDGASSTAYYLLSPWILAAHAAEKRYNRTLHQQARTFPSATIFVCIWYDACRIGELLLHTYRLWGTG